MTARGAQPWTPAAKIWGPRVGRSGQGLRGRHSGWQWVTSLQGPTSPLPQIPREESLTHGGQGWEWEGTRDGSAGELREGTSRPAWPLGFCLTLQAVLLPQVVQRQVPPMRKRPAVWGGEFI